MPIKDLTNHLYIKANRKPCTTHSYPSWFQARQGTVIAWKVDGNKGKWKTQYAQYAVLSMEQQFKWL